MEKVKPEQIQDWANQYLKGTIKPEDKARFEAWYNTLPEGNLTWPDDDIHSAEELKAVIFAEVERSMNTGKSSLRIGRTRWLRTVAAAVAVVAIGLGIYFMFSKNQVSQLPGRTVPALSNIPPGGDKAKLTLANGSVITLDSLANGSIAQQANTLITKSAGGQITYINTGAGTAPSVIQFNTLATPRGGQYRIMLPDGTKVWLDAASSITYPVAFSGPERTVKMTGQAYFEVADNPKMPFIVDIDDRAEVKVLGTHFNVMAYTEEKKIKTTLLEGKISIVANGQPLSSGKVLNPGDEADIDANGNIVKHANTDVDEAVAWKNNYFIFNNSSLESAMNQLARWYDIDVVYDKDADILLNGRFKRNVDLSVALKVLQTATNLNFQVAGDKVIIN